MVPPACSCGTRNDHTATEDAHPRFPVVLPVTDTLLFYTKTDKYIFNTQYQPHDPDYVSKFYRYVDHNGRRYRLDNMSSPNPRPNMMYEYKGYSYPTDGWRYSRETMERLDSEGRLHFPAKPTGRIALKRYLDEMTGTPSGNLWADIPRLEHHSKESLGYPTQKPLPLLERIITASSNPGDVVLDPFCGCGTAIAAAQKLGRQWIGIDITHLSIALQKYRMADMFPGVPFKVVGEPQDIGAARQLASEDRYQFQWWALSKIQARPLGGEEGSKTGKKGSDRGIDGLIPFIDDASGKAKRVIVQVKSGHVKSGDIRDLSGTVEAGNAAIGVFITLEPPSPETNKAAVTAGFYHSDTWDKDYPRIQILTVADLLHGAEVKMPPRIGTFKQAAAVKENANQPGLALGMD